RPVPALPGLQQPHRRHAGVHGRRQRPPRRAGGQQRHLVGRLHARRRRRPGQRLVTPAPGHAAGGGGRATGLPRGRPALVLSTSHEGRTRTMPVQPLGKKGAAVLLGAVALALLAGAGCNKNKRATVTGQVKFNNKPVTAGTISFIGKENRTGAAELDAKGNYTVKDAPVG